MTPLDKRRRALEASAREVGEEIGRVIRERHAKNAVGFAFFVFDYGEGGAMAYVSSADRAGVIGSLKECIARWEAGLSTDPPGEVIKS